MSTPQQPELRRSDTTPGLSPDSIGDELQARRQPDTSGGTGGPVPQENRPGRPSGPVQDKPDLDAFAEKLGMTDQAVAQADRAAQAHQDVDPGPRLPRPLVLAAYLVGGAVGVGVAVRRLTARQGSRLRRMLPG